MKPGPQHDDRQLVFPMIPQDELFRLDFRLRVAVDVPGGQWLGLVGAVVMPGGVDAEAAEIDEALQRQRAAGFEQAARRLDVDGAIILDRSPVADLGGTVKDHLDALQRLAHRGRRRRGRRARLLPVARQQRGVAAGPCESAHRPTALHGGLGEMAAEKAGRAGDETRARHGERSLLMEGVEISSEIKRVLTSGRCECGWIGDFRVSRDARVERRCAGSSRIRLTAAIACFPATGVPAA